MLNNFSFGNRAGAMRRPAGTGRLLWFSLLAPWTAHAGSLADALAEGNLDFQVRPRYESVSQDGKVYNADAFTMRTLLGYSVAPVSSFGGKLEFINVSNLGPNHYNSTENGQTAYPVVADPSVNGVNQAYLDYVGLPGTKMRVGRQVIILDNSRFVGNVDFRQDMQTFDALSLLNGSIPDTELFASHITHTKGSYANYQVPVGYNLQPVNVNLLHATYTPLPGTRLSAYDYLYLDDSVVPGSPADISNATEGLRLDGSHSAGGFDLLYTAEYARQHGYGGGHAGIDANYEFLGGGARLGGFYGRLDYERLGSNASGTYGLQTPLATKHSFNGWADMFLVTPGKGLRDTFATLGAASGKLSVQGMAHDFRAAFDSTRYGSEWDISCVYAIDAHLSASLIYADYAARDGANALLPGTAVPNVNTRKTWLALAYNY